MKNNSDKYNISFLILHYHVIDKTVACVESILSRMDDNNYQIVIVDNASINNTGKELKDKYKDNTNIHIILNEKNLGFSGGNNIGFKYIKDNIKSDFICMMNNDTEIIQDDFFKTIVDEYEMSHCAVMAPEMHLIDETIKSYTMYLVDKEELLSEIKRMKKMLILNRLFLESTNLFLRKIIKKIINYKAIKEKFKVVKEVVPRREMIVLHGCCLIFSPVYIDKFDGIDNKTFFYGEEELLFIRLVENDMLSVYNPKLKIFHAEKASTGAITGKDYKKRRMVYSSHLKACYAILNSEMKNYEKLKPYFKK